MTNYSGIIALIIYVACLIAYIRYDAMHDDEQVQEETTTVAVKTCATPLDVNDEDAVVASLVAAIECRNEYHKNVQIVSVRKVN